MVIFFKPGFSFSVLGTTKFSEFKKLTVMDDLETKRFKNIKRAPVYCARAARSTSEVHSADFLTDSPSFFFIDPRNLKALPLANCWTHGDPIIGTVRYNRCPYTTEKTLGKMSDCRCGARTVEEQISESS